MHKVEYGGLHLLCSKYDYYGHKARDCKSAGVQQTVTPKTNRNIVIDRWTTIEKLEKFLDALQVGKKKFDLNHSSLGTLAIVFKI